MNVNGADSWDQQTLGLSPAELVIAAALDADGTTGIAIGDEGSVSTYMDENDEKLTWRTTGAELNPRARIRKVALNPDGTIGVAESGDGSILILKKYPHMMEWREWSPKSILRAMGQDDVLRTQVSGFISIDRIDITG